MAPNYGPKTVTNGLVLCIDAANPRSYPGSGTTLFDLSSYKTSPIVYQATYSNNYFEFDGTDDNIYISNLSTNAPQIGQIREFVSAEIAFYPYSTGGDDAPALIRCGLGSDLTFAYFYNRTSRLFSLQWYDGAFKNASSSSNVINLNSWNIGTFSRNGSSVSFYINGSLINTVTGLTTPTPTPANLGIGAARAATAVGTTSQDMAGRISYVKIYNLALTASEIQQNFNAIKGRYGL